MIGQWLSTVGLCYCNVIVNSMTVLYWHSEVVVICVWVNRLCQTSWYVQPYTFPEYESYRLNRCANFPDFCCGSYNIQYTVHFELDPMAIEQCIACYDYAQHLTSIVTHTCCGTHLSLSLSMSFSLCLCLSLFRSLSVSFSLSLYLSLSPAALRLQTKQTAGSGA